MSDHYYTDQPSSEHDEKTITVRLAGHVYQFITDSGVFSKNRMDQGSEILFKTFVEHIICDVSISVVFWFLRIGYF